MVNRVDAKTLERIFVLRQRDRLTIKVIATRLGLGMRTVYRSLRQLRDEGRLTGHITAERY